MILCIVMKPKIYYNVYNTIDENTMKNNYMIRGSQISKKVTRGTILELITL